MSKADRSMRETSFTRLVGCSVPIQLAAMPGVCTPELTLAVSNAGGLGMTSGVNVTPDVMAATLKDLVSRSQGPVGVNFLMPFLNRESVAVAAEHARVVEFFYGDPDASLVELVHASGALASWQVGSTDEALAAVGAGCDLIVAQGTEAGGHVRGRLALLTLLAEVLDVVSVPVVAAGGIGTARSLSAVLAAGAAGARLGTRFVAAQESGAHAEYVQALIGARAEDTVLTEAFSVGWPDAPHRVLRSCVAAAQSFQGDVVAHTTTRGAVLPIPRFAPLTAHKAVVGNIRAMALYAGESVNAVHGVEPAADIMRDLIAGAEKYLLLWARP